MEKLKIYFHNLLPSFTDIPEIFTVDGTTVSNPMAISNISNKRKLKISFSRHLHYSDFLKNRPNISLLITPADKTEIENAISSLDSSKSVGSNCIPTKVLKLLKNDISSQLSETFNIYFSCGVFP